MLTALTEQTFIWVNEGTAAKEMVFLAKKGKLGLSVGSWGRRISRNAPRNGLEPG